VYKLKWHNSFIKVYEKKAKNNIITKNKIMETLRLLVENPQNPKLKTHKLHGILQGLFACSIDYDLRIVFSFDNIESNTIILIDIGTHDEVY